MCVCVCVCVCGVGRGVKGVGVRVGGACGGLGVLGWRGGGKWGKGRGSKSDHNTVLWKYKSP